jgi:hypothetical protein
VLVASWVIVSDAWLYAVLEMDIQKCWYTSYKRKKGIPPEKWKKINGYNI